MKKFLGLLSIMALTVFVTMPLYSQTAYQPEKITVNKSDLTQTQLLKIENDAKVAELQKKLETYGNWVGVGGEIGTAVKEGLNAVVDVADKFGSTNVGKFTMVMVAWKVIGKDLVRIGLGILLIIIVTSFIFINYKKNFTTRKIMTEGNWLLFWQPRKYEIVHPREYDGYEFVKYLYLLTLVGSYGIAYAIMFA
jgi:hypothetical protein